MRQLSTLVVLSAASAFAADGVREINAADVAAAGGYPYVISDPGSYILTGNLTLGPDDEDAIRIGVDSVSLDLNGFRISGNGSGSGISTFDPVRETSFDDTHISNGTVANFESGVGIRSGSVRRVSVERVAEVGISAREGTVANCSVSLAFEIAIFGAIVTDNVVSAARDAVWLTGPIARGNVLISNLRGILVRTDGPASISENSIVVGDDLQAIAIQAGDFTRVSFSRNNIRGSAQGVLGDCNLVSGLLACP